MTQPQALLSSVVLGRSVVMPGNARLDLAYTNTAIVQPLPAGLVTKHAVKGGQFEIPQQITLTFKTDATVADRYVGILFFDSNADVIGQVFCNGAQAASTSYRYTFILDAGGSFVSGIFGMAPLPYLVLPPTSYWEPTASGIQPGDQQDGLTHTELVIPNGPPLAPPATVLATPVLV